MTARQRQAIGRRGLRGKDKRSTCNPHRLSRYLLAGQELATEEHSTTLEYTMANKRLARDGMKDSVEGKAKVAKGRVKDAVGKVQRKLGRTGPDKNRA